MGVEKFDSKYRKIFGKVYYKGKQRNGVAGREIMIKKSFISNQKSNSLLIN